MRRKKKCFENNKQIGAYINIHFDIIGETELGKESIRFETPVHYIDAGKGEPLLMVHGIGQSLYTWRNSIDFFAEKGYRVLALDLPGFGYSGHPEIYYTVEEYALVIKAFLDALKIKQAHIMAFSTGCLSALCFADKYPARVGRMVLISPGGPNEGYPFRIKFLTTRLGQILFKMIFRETTMYEILSMMYFDATLITEDVLQGYYAPYRCKDVRETLCISLMHFDEGYTLSLLKGIKCDTLIFSGIDDRIHTKDIVRDYAVNIPGAKPICLRHCGHFVHEEKPVIVNRDILQFLKTEAQTV